MGFGDIGLWDSPTCVWLQLIFSIMESILNKLFILNKFDLFWIFRFRLWFEFLTKLTFDFISKFFQDWLLFEGVLFGMHFFGFDFLKDGVYKFDEGIDKPKNGGGDGEIKASHTDIDIGLIAIWVEIIDNNEYLNDDNAETIDEPDEYFGFASINLSNY